MVLIFPCFFLSQWRHVSKFKLKFSSEININIEQSATVKISIEESTKVDCMKIMVIGETHTHQEFDK